MKALSIYAPYVDAIARGVKREEYRSRATKHRGDLLICAAARTSGDIYHPEELDDRMDPARLHAYKRINYGWYLIDWRGLYVCGHAICIADLTDCLPYRSGGFAWRLENIRMIRPVPVKGTQNFFNVDDGLISVIRGKYPAARRLWVEMGLVDKI